MGYRCRTTSRYIVADPCMYVFRFIFTCTFTQMKQWNKGECMHSISKTSNASNTYMLQTVFVYKWIWNGKRKRSIIYVSVSIAGMDSFIYRRGTRICYE